MSKKLLPALLFGVLFLFACEQTYTPDHAPEANSSLSSSESFPVTQSSSSLKASTVNILEAVQETGRYTTKDSVAAYIHQFKKLPGNYVNKSTGQFMYEQKGYTFSKWDFIPWDSLGVMIGGDYYGNYEGLLPTGNYNECDVDYHDDSRGTKRLVYTKTGVVYYTGNHYETFTLIYE